MSFDDESNSQSEGISEVDRAAILTPAITSVISALGGQQGGKYILGDEAYGCLKDLKKFWRKDDTDDDRTVARIFWKARVLHNDLVPIVLETAGKGIVEDKCAIICAELITSMTWPIDIAAELMELDEVMDVKADFTILLNSHLSYKATLLQPGVLQAIFGIILPCLAKSRKERTDRDGQIISIVLYLIRNLAFIRDLPSTSTQSSDQAEHSNLQNKLIVTLSDTHILDALITLAVNVEKDPLFNSWNTILLETFYLLFRGIKPAFLVKDREQANKTDLVNLLDIEKKRRRLVQRYAASRHSRFGTTISVRTNQESQPMVLHRQEAIKKEARDIVDTDKKAKYKKMRTLDEIGTQDNLGSEAMTILQSVARDFLESCFNPFLSSLLKDIKSERPKITEKDNLCLLFVTKWFLEFFLLSSSEKGNGSDNPIWAADFQMVVEIVERSWIVWVLRRMRGALEEKPKQWVELRAGVECLTQLLLLIDAMSCASDPTLCEAAEILQHQLYYNGEILDLAYEGLLGYKEQSVAYLDSTIHLAYILLRMLEKWGKKKGDVYVRRRRMRAKNRRQRKEGEDVLDVDDVEEIAPPEDNSIIEEQMFSFDKFEAKFASEDITHTLLSYLSRFKELSEDNVKRIVSLIHRQAVKAKAEGLFFKVSALDLFKSILQEQTMFPKTQPYKELIQLVNYILRQFFKAVEKEPFLIVEAFFPKNRGLWKPYSSWEPEKTNRSGKVAKETLSKHPPDVRVKRGFSWGQQVGIVIAHLVESDKKHLVDWIKEILTTVIGIRQRIIQETNHTETDEDEDGNEDERILRKAALLQKPSSDAVAKFEDYLIPYVNDEQAEAATRNPHFKLICRLVKFYLLDDNADELEWYVPAAILPSDLSESLSVINQFLETPIDLNGKNTSQMFSKKARTRRGRTPSEEHQALSDGEESEDRARKAQKKKEKAQYKSAQFIEDSDAELGDDEAFFRKEAELRERTALAATQGAAVTMVKPSETKKRKKGVGKGERRNKKRKSSSALDKESEELVTVLVSNKISDPKISGDGESDEEESFNVQEVPTERLKPKPKPKMRVTREIPPSENEETNESRFSLENNESRTEPLFMDDNDSGSNSDDTRPVKFRRRDITIISDDED